MPGKHDADWCKKQYSASSANGETVVRTKKWFGFRLHLIADATYEMPVAFCVTKASSKYFLGDKGYDSGRIISHLEEKGIVPIIDIRNCWKGGGGDASVLGYESGLQL